MTPAKTGNTIRHFRRFVLTLSLSADEDPIQTIEHTAQLARELNSDVACLCVRDSDLLDYAALPFAREFSVHGALTRPLNADDMRNEMNHRASSIHQILEKLTSDQQRQSTFHIVDGRLVEKAMEAAEENDLLVVTVASRTPGHVGPAYENIRRVVEQTRRDLLMLAGAGAPRTGPVVLLVDEDVPSGRTLRIALHVAQSRQSGLDIFIADDVALSRAVRQRCDEIFTLDDNPAPHLSINSLNRCLSRPWRPHPCSLMVLEFDKGLPSLGFLDQSLRIFQAPLLLLRRHINESPSV